MIDRDMKTECWSCVNKRPVPGDCHIYCAKPDHNMTGNKHGIAKGWFMYPLLFDPVWKTKLCANYEAEQSVSRAISDAVSLET